MNTRDTGAHNIGTVLYQQHHHVDLMVGTSATICDRDIFDHSSIEYLLLIDKLQREQIGLKLAISVLPPLLSGILCPT